VVIGQKVKALREQKNMSQGDIEKRTGLLRCYVSRVENGHTVPSIDTLEKLARALEIPMYRFFHGRRSCKKTEYPGRGQTEPSGQLKAGARAARLRKMFLAHGR
jgi:transcriptional regulator with XRE-family HTH domain